MYSRSIYGRQSWHNYNPTMMVVVLFVRLPNCDTHYWLHEHEEIIMYKVLIRDYECLKRECYHIIKH